MAAGSAAGRRGSIRHLALPGACLLLLAAEPGAAQGGDTWSSLAPLPTPRRLLAAAAEGGRLYTFGGCGSPCFGPPSHTSAFEETRIEVFEPASNTWAVRGPMPAIFFGGAAAAPGIGRIYLLGGFLTGGRLFEYDPAGDAWRTRAPLPKPRHGLAAVALGGKVYALGGSDGQRASAAVEIYDPATDSWTRGAPLPTPRVFLAAAAVDGRIYAVGGSPDCCGDATTAAVEVYDPATDRWSRAAPLPGGRQVSAAASVGGKLYALGGFVPGSGVLAETLEYDPVTDTWTPRAPMPTGRDQAPAVVLEDRIFVPGGSVDCHCQALTTHHVYTPEPPDDADLSITIDDGVETAGAGQRVVYTIRVTNHGAVPVTGAPVRSDVVPSRLTTIERRCLPNPDARCVVTGGSDDGTEILRARVDLPVGGVVELEIEGTVTPATSCPTDSSLTATARVFPPDGVEDSRPGDNRDTDTDAIRVRTDLVVTKDDGVETVAEGEEVAYSIGVENRGPDAACGVRVRDLFPPELEDVTWGCVTVSPPTCTARGTGDLEDTVVLRPRDAVSYGARGIAVCTGAEALENTATAEPPAGARDPRPGDDSATDRDLLDCSPELFPIPALSPGALLLLAGLLAGLGWLAAGVAAPR